MGIVDFIALIFAASGWVDLWFNGSLFDEWRAYFQARDDFTEDEDYPDDNPSCSLSAPDPEPPRPLWMWLFDWLPDWFCELVSCKFCFSHHTPWLLAMFFLLPAMFVPAGWAFVLKVPVYCLAATRIGNIINAYVPTDARYDRGTEAFTNEETHG